MSENAKTITFVVIGLVAIVIGLVTRPSSAELDETTLVGEYLTKDLSADDAKRLRIVRFDEDTATVRDFEVAENDGLWAIPSKDGYPADAAQQMAEAATSLMDRKILQVASTSNADHEEYGVIDPTSPKLQPGQKGVGTRVTMSDAQNKPLVDLIVGKAVKGAEGQRYVREAGRALVYAIEIDRSKLSTNFEDWIEKDLLKLNAWDMQQVDIKDYSAALVQVMTDQGPSIGIDQDRRAEMTLAYNDTDSKWNPVKLRAFDATKGADGEHVDFSLAEDEELNTENLNGLKTALDDLQIVDVVRKPEGLSEDLKAGEEFVKNREAMIELMSKGFTPDMTGQGAPQEIISSDGEVVATMKNGVEYVLRFGNLTSGDGPADEAATAEQPADPAASAADAKKNDSDVSRYLFVMARMNKGAIKKPELQDLPELPADAKPAEEAKSEDAAAAPAEGEAAGATDPAPPAADPAAPATEEAKNPAAPADAAATAENPAAETDAKNKEDAAKADDAAAPDGAAATDEAAATDDAAKKDEAAAAANKEKNEEVEKVIAERRRIETENQRKLDEYNDAIKKGEEQMKELNLRFGDWYFVVDDDVFKKIRLGRADVIKKKEAPKAEGAADGATPAAQPGAVPGLPVIPGATP
jgi:hypothetical protein